MSQLLRVGPTVLAGDPPANRWRPANMTDLGQLMGCDLYTFLLRAGSSRHGRRGGPCSVLYSDPLRAVGMPVPYEMRKMGLTTMVARQAGN